jgi:hypothetical protein
MQDVGGNDDHCAAPDRRGGKLVGAARNPADRCERRIEPQCLLNDCPGFDQAVKKRLGRAVKLTRCLGGRLPPG